MKKIAFSGSHGSGKTTLADNLEKKLGICGRIKSVARLCPFPINKETSVTAQLWIMVTRIQTELENEKGNGYLISDRTILDDFAYLMWLDTYAKEMLPFSDLVRVGENVFQVDEYENYIWMARQMVSTWMKTYDIVFFVKPLANVVADDVRVKDKEFQLQIHDIIEKYLIATRTKYTVIEPDTVETRMKEINNAVDCKAFL